MVTRRGFSLVEVIVAMVLLSIAMLGVAASGIFAVHVQQQAAQREAAALRTQHVLDSLVANAVQGADREVADTHTLEWHAAAASVVVRATFPSGEVFELRARR